MAVALQDEDEDQTQTVRSTIATIHSPALPTIALIANRSLGGGYCCCIEFPCLRVTHAGRDWRCSRRRRASLIRLGGHPRGHEHAFRAEHTDAEGPTGAGTTSAFEEGFGSEATAAESRETWSSQASVRSRGASGPRLQSLTCQAAAAYRQHNRQLGACVCWEG